MSVRDCASNIACTPFISRETPPIIRLPTFLCDTHPRSRAVLSPNRHPRACIESHSVCVERPSMSPILPTLVPQNLETIPISSTSLSFIHSRRHSVCPPFPDKENKKPPSILLKHIPLLAWPSSPPHLSCPATPSTPPTFPLTANSALTHLPHFEAL